jgi:hypothetical protein
MGARSRGAAEGKKPIPEPSEEEAGEREVAKEQAKAGGEAATAQPTNLMSSKRRLPAGSQVLTKAGEADGKAVVEVVSPKRGQSQKKVRGRRRKPDALLEVANVTAGQARALEGGIPAASGAMFSGMRLGNPGTAPQTAGGAGGAQPPQPYHQSLHDALPWLAGMRYMPSAGQLSQSMVSLMPPLYDQLIQVQPPLGLSFPVD